MPDWLQALLLGVVQGLTEFLPVSSSAHLVLAQAWLGDAFFAADDTLLFDLVLHLGTLLPVLHFYRADLGRIARAVLQRPATGQSWGAWAIGDVDRRLGLYVVAATVPTGLMGVAFEDQFEALFSKVAPVCAFLLVTAGLLLSTRWKAPAATRPLDLRLALALGLVQGLAITPGISRSGSTISAGLLLGLERADAARFSFLLSVPAILGAVVLKSRHGLHLGGADPVAVAVGFFAAMVTGYGALTFLVRIVRRGGLHHFAWYVIALAAVGWTTLA